MKTHTVRRPRYVLFAAALAILTGPAVTLAAANTCDRVCLEGVAETYLAALAQHDPAKAPIQPGTRYTENAVELRLPDGLWRTAGPIGKYRLYVSDPERGEIGFFAKGTENGAPVLIATRLKVVKGRITEIESYVPRLGNNITEGPGSSPRVDELGEVTRTQFTTTLPPDKRLPREKLVSIASTYYSGIENNNGSKVPPFADDCMRLENGSPTTGVPLAAGAKPTTHNMKCKDAFGLGYYREDTRLRNRRILAVDTERGLVYMGCFFDHDATVRSYQVKDGATRTVTQTAPWTWGTHEIFQINAAGQISQIEAVLLAFPYGTRPGWDTGQHIISEAARKDGFKEY